MYKSLYDYKTGDKTQLKVRTGQTFEFVKAHDEHWWLMTCQENGKTGLVPSSFLTELKQKTTLEEISSELDSIDRAIEAVRRNSKKPGKLDKKEQAKLQKLIEQREQVSSEYLKVKNLAQNKQQSGMGTISSDLGIPLQPNRPAPEPPMVGKKRKAPMPPSNCNIPLSIGSELVEQIRISTRLPYTKSITAVETLLSHITNRVPSLSKEVDYILESLYYFKDNSCSVSDEELLNTHDGICLRALFDELVKCKDDSQQRSWALHEDEDTISQFLTDIISILNDANPNVCLAGIRHDSYYALNAMVEYYQMETRRTLRILLLQVLCGCCSLGAEVSSQLLCTVLPVELARDMQTNCKDTDKLLKSAQLCTMIYSTGEALPYHHYEYLNEEFVKYLVAMIENPPCESDDEEIFVNTFVTLILSFNQHFQDVKNNTVMKILSDKGTSKVLTEKLMLLVNREDDPVNIFGNLNPIQNSLLKFYEDIFSSESTSGLFFTTDLMVLIDIVLRKVSDLSPGEELRTEYLSLLHSIMMTTNYGEYKYRHEELGKCLRRISKEEAADVEKDHLVVKEILQKFPGLF